MATTRELYNAVASQGLITLTVGDKPVFQSPIWMFPSGGGIYGFDSSSATLNFGSPRDPAIIRFARPVVVPVRQRFEVIIDFFPIGNAPLAQDLLNEDGNDTRVVQIALDTILTRDVM